MADPKRTGAIQPLTPTEPLFSLNDVISAPSLVDATAVATDALYQLDKQRNAMEIDSLQKKSQLLDTTVRGAQEVFKSQEETTRRITTAQSRRSQIEKIPPVIGRIMGLFDKDYDWSYWNEQVRSGKIEAATNDEKLTQLQMLSRLQEEGINNSLAVVQSNYSMLSQGFDRALNLRKIQAEEEQRAFSNKLALSQEARAGRAEQRDIATFEMNRTLFQQGQEKHAIETMDDETLAAAEAGKVPGANKALVIEERIRRTERNLNLERIALGNKTGDAALEDAGRMRFLSSESASTLTDLAERAQANKGHVTLNTEYGEVSFTAQELRKAAADAAASDLTTRKSVTDRAIKIAETKNNVNILQETAINISHAAGSQGLHPKAQRILGKALVQINKAVELGDFDTAGDLAEKYVPEMDKVAEDIIKEFPTTSQPFVRSRFDQRPANVDEVTSFIGDGVFNPGALQQPIDEKLASLQRQLAEEAKKIASTSLTFGKDEEGRTVISGGDSLVKRGQIIQTALGNIINDTPEKLGLRTQFRQSRDIDAYIMAIGQLSQKVPWLAGVTSLGQFPDPQDPSKFSTGRFLTFLRDKFQQDIDTGRIPIAMVDGGAIRPYDKQFLDYMRNSAFQQELAKNWGQFSIQGDALFQAITGGNPLIDYRDTLDATEQEFDVHYANEKAAISKISPTQMGHFRRIYAQQINQLALGKQKEDPGLSYSEARKQSESELFKKLFPQELQGGAY